MQTNCTTKEKSKPVYPREFISTLACMAAKTLNDWLIANNAPKEVISLAGGCGLLERMDNDNYDNLSDRDNRELELEVPVILWEIAMLGGEFHSAGICSYPREDTIKWERQEQMTGV